MWMPFCRRQPLWRTVKWELEKCFVRAGKRKVWNESFFSNSWRGLCINLEILCIGQRECTRHPPPLPPPPSPWGTQSWHSPSPWSGISLSTSSEVGRTLSYFYRWLMIMSYLLWSHESQVLIITSINSKN